MSDDILELRSFPSLKDFTDRELAMLISASERREHPKGRVLFKQGSRGSSSILVVRGEVDVVLDAHAPERHLATMGPGSFVGQIALVDKGPRSATVRARTDVVVIELLRDTFEGLLKARSPLALRFQELIAVAGIRQHRAAVRRLTALAAERNRAVNPVKPTDETLAYIQTAASEWGLDLDAIEVVQDETAPKGMRRG
ncbi:MAG: cyclic nucleotide-binding domain-containing protein [Deltaproteobacteria bacterium]|nr:cyclic nucleotide-binding domain-containing protein [Deltaproteobacteria bacterium]